MKLSWCVSLSFLLCYFAAVVSGSSSSESDQNDVISNPIELLEGFVKYFKASQDKNREQEKVIEELKEQFVLLSQKFDQLESKISEDSGVWLLTPPIRGPPGKQGEKGDSAGFRGSQSMSIRSTTPLQTKSEQEIQWEMNRPGENWIVADEISHWEPNGRWGNAQLCPPGKFVTAHKFTYFLNSGLTGVELTCTNKYNTNKGENDHLIRIKSADVSKITAIGEEWDIRNRGSRTNFAQGFSLNRRILETRGSAPEIRKMSKTYDLIYHGQNPEESASNYSGIVTKCPENHAICGLLPMMDNKGLGILSAIGFKCCDVCTPEEKWVTVNQFNNTESSNETVEFRTTVGLEQSPRSFISNSTFNLTILDLESAVDSIGISPSDFYQEFSAHLAKSNSTGFDWTAFSTSTNETNPTKTFTCGPQNSCVYQQLVGQCGSVQIPVDKFCQGSAPIGSPIPESCTDSRITSCSSAMETLPSPRANKHRIYPHGNTTKVEVLCDFETDGGGWTIIQKRSRGPREEFKQNWNAYANGFGSPQGNFWLGLDNIHALTKNGDQELRIELEDFEGERKWAKYSSFSVSDAADFYRLTISGFSASSTAGDSMTNSNYGTPYLNNGQRFTTKDKDNDLYSLNCAVEGYGSGGGWWYPNGCAYSNLNGLYLEKGETNVAYKGIAWYSWKSWSHSLAKSEMKIRKRRS